MTDSGTHAAVSIPEPRPASPFSGYQSPTSSSLDSFNDPKAESASQLGDPPEIYPEESASQVDSDYDSDDDFDDDFGDDFEPNDNDSYLPSDLVNHISTGLENDSDSAIYASSKLSAGNKGDKAWKIFRERLRRAKVVSVKQVLSVHKEALKGLQDLEPLDDVLEIKLIGELVILRERLTEVPSYQESYLEGHMNPILVEAIGEYELVEIRHHNVKWNLVPNILTKRACGLSCPMPDGTTAYPTLGRKGDTLIPTPDGDQHPLGRQVIEYILRSKKYAKVLPLNHTSLSQTTGIHDVMILEYKADDSEESQEVGLNQDVNVGLFKVWQDVDLALALGGAWKQRILQDSPFCLVWRICGTYWAIEYVAAVLTDFKDGELQPTRHYTIAEGDWAHDPRTFLRTAREAYSICAKRVNAIRGGMMQALHERVQQDEKDGGEFSTEPIDKIAQRVYLKKPPTATMSQVATTNNAKKEDAARKNAGSDTQTAAGSQTVVQNQTAIQKQTAVQTQTAVETQTALETQTVVQTQIAVQAQTAVPEQTAAQENSDAADDLVQTMENVSLDSDSKTVVKGESQ